MSNIHTLTSMSNKENAPPPWQWQLERTLKLLMMHSHLLSIRIDILERTFPSKLGNILPSQVRQFQYVPHSFWNNYIPKP